jgi:hypothetical protein
VTLEHAVPQWARKFLTGEGAYTHRRELGGEWSKAQLDVTVSAVCKPCNTGWMSNLEGLAGGLVAGAIAGRGVQTWTPRQQRQVATWTYKTALMMDRASGGIERVPPAHYRFLKKNLHPPGCVRVWTAIHIPRGPTSTFQAAFSKGTQLHLEHASGMTLHAYTITANIGHFAFQVLGYAGRHQINVNPGTIQNYAPVDYEIGIWPVQAVPVEWPPRVAFDPTALTEYANRFVTP